jgi:hypothetical protein
MGGGTWIHNSLSSLPRVLENPELTKFNFIFKKIIHPKKLLKSYLPKTVCERDDWECHPEFLPSACCISFP